jgi:hypothetical protein
MIPGPAKPKFSFQLFEKMCVPLSASKIKKPFIKDKYTPGEFGKEELPLEKVLTMGPYISKGKKASGSPSYRAFRICPPVHTLGNFVKFLATRLLRLFRNRISLPLLRLILLANTWQLVTVYVVLLFYRKLDVFAVNLSREVALFCSIL